jgi:hypothetical protein
MIPARPPPGTYYFVSTKRRPPLLLRQICDNEGLREEAYLDGRWQQTKLLRDRRPGHNNVVDQISERAARALEPAAFS